MRWFGLALLGILAAVAIAFAASRLASQQIGLASQPVSAGDALAPAPVRKPAHRAPTHRPGKHEQAHKAPEQPEPTAPSEPPEPQTTEPAPLPAPVEEPRAGGGEGADD